jgi:hypothetical protein
MFLVLNQVLLLDMRKVSLASTYTEATPVLIHLLQVGIVEWN